MSEKIIVGMSGGVDSSVTALTLLEQGHDVSGLFMKNWEEDDDNGQCRATEDLEDAQQVCDRLGIPLRTANFSAEYWDDVFETFIREHEAGRTPNPDILCNRDIKFRAFLDFARDLGAEKIATGHYARIQLRGDSYRLLKGLDHNKDQSYFLYALRQDQLAASYFPIGEMIKPDVRKIAEKAGFITADKKDSTGICFIGERRFREFLKRFVTAEPGEMRTPEGQLVGRHEGLAYYTIGQRQGLGIGGVRGASDAPWFVLGKRHEDNTLLVGQGHDHPALYHRELIASQLTWTGKLPQTGTFRCSAKIRYRQSDQPCQVTVEDDRCHVVFDQPQRAITPGQSVVFYQQDECLGGGIIDQRLAGLAETA